MVGYATNGQIMMIPTCSAAAFNQYTVSNDAGLFYAINTNNNQGLNIGPWSNTGGGIRLDAAGNTKVNGTLTVTGITTLGPTGSNTVLTVGGTNYSASTVQAAFALPSAPVFTGNITLPSTLPAFSVGQLGYTLTTLGGAQSGAVPNQILNLCQFNLPIGVWSIIGTMQYQTPDNASFNQIVTAISTTSLGYDSDTFGFLRTYAPGTGVS